MADISAAIEEWLASNPVDEKAAGSLREAEPAIQQLVLSQGTLLGSNNPSAALMGRINKAWAHYSMGGDMGFSAMEIQGGTTEMAESWEGTGNDTAWIEDFIVSNNIDMHAAKALRDSEPEIQQMVVLQGPLTGSKNPSAALIGRINKTWAQYLDYAMGSGGMAVGPEASHTLTGETGATSWSPKVVQSPTKVVGPKRFLQANDESPAKRIKGGKG